VPYLDFFPDINKGEFDMRLDHWSAKLASIARKLARIHLPQTQTRSNIQVLLSLTASDTFFLKSLMLLSFDNTQRKG
jgi:hypothetical protein